MTGIVTNLLVNIIIVVLLAVTIGYCWVLNRRIKVLQDSKGELAQLLKHFDESTERASQSIIALQTASKKIGENIQMRIEKANYMIDDLAFMIEKGNKIANQMEAGFAIQRARSRVVAQEPQDNVEAEPLPPTSKSPEPVAAKAAKPVSNREKAAHSLGAVLERVAGRNKNLAAENAAEEEVDLSPRASRAARSKSEQELLNLLKAGLKG